MPISLPVLTVALLVTVVAAAVQGTVGFGFAVISVPVLSLIDPVLVPVPQLLAVVPLTAATFWRERHSVDLSGTGWIIAGRLPGAVAGLALLEFASRRDGARLLDLLIAGSVLVAVAVQVSRFQVRRTPTTKFGAGFVSGVTGLVASIGGPPLGLLYRGERGATLRSTLAAVFMVGLAITITTRVLAGRITADDVRIGALLIPAQAAGFLLSSRFSHAMEGRRLEVAVLGLSALAALGLIARALL